MARRTRASKSRQSTATEIATSPYIRRVIPFFDPLDDGQVERLEAQVDWIMEKVGIAFRDDPVALDIWRQAGACIDGDTVRMPATPTARLQSGATIRYLPRSTVPRLCAI
jgi:trimethylamine--corrinoid protein Co-methyltransferase